MAHRWNESLWPLGLFPAVLISSFVFGSFQATKERLKVHAEDMLQCWQNCIRETGGSRRLVQFLSWGRPQCSSKCHQMFAFLGWQYATPIEVQWVNTASNWYFPSPSKPPAQWIIAVLWANEGKTHPDKTLPSIAEEAFGKSEAESPMNSLPDRTSPVPWITWVP